MSTLSLTLTHAKYSLIETTRVPIAMIGSFVFPSLALLFFVVPQQVVASNPEFATQAVISLCVFSVMSNSLFGFGITIAEDREKAWDPYVRTLPVPGIARIGASLLSTGGLGMLSIVPVIVIGAVFTAAEASLGRILLGFVVLALASLPFMLIGICIGYALPAKAAIAIVQIVMFGFAFAGGLFLPPQMFAPWLDTLSRFFPSREAREVVIGTVQGSQIDLWAPLGLVAWIAALLALALLLIKQDQGRRFR